MTKVEINSGACGFITEVEAEHVKRKIVRIKVQSTCPNLQEMIENLDSEYDGFEVMFSRVGKGPLFEMEHMPRHSDCPVLSGIAKCIEVEAQMALPRNATIIFKET